MSFSADDTTVEIVLMSGKCLDAQVSDCESQDCNSQLEIDCVAALLRLAKEPVEFPQTKRTAAFKQLQSLRAAHEKLAIRCAALLNKK